MKKIKLLKPLETPTGRHEIGEEVEVDDNTYNWLIGVYLAERKAKAAELKKVPDIFGDAE